MSTSTYVPTFLSLRNWPDKTVIETVPAMIPSTYKCKNMSNCSIMKIVHCKREYTVHAKGTFLLRLIKGLYHAKIRESYSWGISGDNFILVQQMVSSILQAIFQDWRNTLVKLFAEANKAFNDIKAKFNLNFQLGFCTKDLFISKRTRMPQIHRLCMHRKLKRVN